jgi:hypothetical protein
LCKAFAYAKFLIILNNVPPISAEQGPADFAGREKGRRDKVGDVVD